MLIYQNAALLLIFSQSDYLIRIVKKITYLMANSADPDQLTFRKQLNLDLHCLQRQSLSGFSRIRVKKLPAAHFAF